MNAMRRVVIAVVVGLGSAPIPSATAASQDPVDRAFEAAIARLTPAERALMAAPLVDHGPALAACREHAAQLRQSASTPREPRSLLEVPQQAVRQVDQQEDEQLSACVEIALFFALRREQLMRTARPSTYLEGGTGLLQRLELRIADLESEGLRAGAEHGSSRVLTVHDPQSLARFDISLFPGLPETLRSTIEPQDMSSRGADFERCEPLVGQVCLQRVRPVGARDDEGRTEIAFARANVSVRAFGPAATTIPVVRWLDGLIAAAVERDGSPSVDPKGIAVVLDRPVRSRGEANGSARATTETLLVIEEPLPSGVLGHVVPDDESEIAVVVRVIGSGAETVSLSNGESSQVQPLVNGRASARLALLGPSTVITATARARDATGEEQLLTSESLAVITVSEAARRARLMPYPEALRR